MVTKKRKQELFNIAWNGIKSQGFQQSVLRNEDGSPKVIPGGDGAASCAYRDPQGRKCAVGWMIPDENYHPGLENKLASSPEVCKAADLVGGEWDEEPNFARHLQTVHDSSASRTPEGMERNLREFALNHGLDIPQDA